MAIFKKILFLSFFYISVSNAQHVFDFDTFNFDNSTSEEIFDTFILEEGVTYNLTIEGTFGVQNADTPSDLCILDEIDLDPIYPSGNSSEPTNNVCCDMRYVFSYSTENLCADISVSSETSGRIQITLDNGNTWYAASNDELFNEDHIYNYVIIGEGYPIGVRHSDPQNSDDNGILRFTFKEDIEIDNLTLYPNPTSDYLYIEKNEETKISDINLIDLTGQKFNLDYNTSETSIAIDVSILAKAMYIIQIITFEEVIHERLIID